MESYNISLTLTCCGRSSGPEGQARCSVWLGDAAGYGEYFCDAMEEIYSTFKSAGAKMVGHWPAEGYEHEGSKVGTHS